MGFRFSKHSPPLRSPVTIASRGMADSSTAEARCLCSTVASSSAAACSYCRPQTGGRDTPSGSGTNVEEPAAVQSRGRSDFGPRRAFRSLSLGHKRQSKTKDKSGEKNKSGKPSWTLRWKMKASPANEAQEPMIDLARFNPADYPIEDKDEVARLERAREIAEGVEMDIESLPSCYRLRSDSSGPEAAAVPCETVAEVVPLPVMEVPIIPPLLPAVPDEPVAELLPGPSSSTVLEGLTVLLHRSLAISIDSHRTWNVLTHVDLDFLVQHFHWHQHQHGPQGMFTLTPRGEGSNRELPDPDSDSPGADLLRQAHTQVDYLHCLVPDLLDITKCSFYWGKMDRYEAERLLENRPDGTFLLRDSAQEEYLFSVSFRRYSRSLHARIEQWNHRFSFDSHDPGVYSSPTILGLIDHYKNPELCMFFEPTLTLPLHRNGAFSLQHLCRSVICSNTTYDGVNALNLPKALKLYLKEYHYKQRIRVRRLDG